MASEQLFVLVIIVIAVMPVIVGAIMYAYMDRHRIKRVIIDRFHVSAGSQQRRPFEAEQLLTAHESEDLNSEQGSETELTRLKKLIEERKRMAKDIDISHHLARPAGPPPG